MGVTMAKINLNPKLVIILRSFIPAAIFIFLALMWTEQRELVRYSSGIAGIAFLIEGIIRLWKYQKSSDENSEKSTD